MTIRMLELDSRQIHAQRVCPVCESDQRCLKYQKQCKMTAHWVDFYRCGACDFVYSGAFLSPEASLRYYDAKHQYCNYASYTKPSVEVGKKINFRQRVALLEKTIQSTGSRALDIGCGSGQSLEVLADCGYQPTGLEISPYAARAAQARGVGEVHCADALQLPGLNLPLFDVVFLFDVLDHVNQPKKVMQAVFDQMQPGGGLLLEVVNIASVLAHVMGSHYLHLIPYEHLSYFSPKTLRAFLTRCGFDVIAVVPAYRYVTFDLIVTTTLEFNPRLGRLLQWVGQGIGPRWREKNFSIPCGALCGLAVRRAHG